MRALQWGSSLVHHQLRLLASLVLWVRGRQHGLPPGAAAMRYDHAVGPMLLLVLGLSVVEIVVVDLVLPWPAPRLVLLLLGAYASLFIVATIAANRVRPHVLSGGYLRLRSGVSADVHVPLRSLARAVAGHRDATDRTVVLTGDVLAMGVAG